MPLKKCTQDGKSGWKFGDSGKCFLGKDAREKGRKQGVAIKISQQKKGKADRPSLISQVIEYLENKENRKN